MFGPSQVEATINQDPEISAQRTLWGQQGSEVILGNLLVTPIEDSLLYVQPLYLQSDQTQLPQLKRVIVFYRAPAPAGGQGNAQQVVAMKPTLAEALTAAFGQSFLPGNESGGTDTGRHRRHRRHGRHRRRRRARSTSRRATSSRRRASSSTTRRTALQAGDFAEYGRRITALEQALTDLQRLQQQ